MSEPYTPSNGTEAAIFWANWCERCAKDKSMSEGKDWDLCEPDEVCDILSNSFVKQVAEWIEDGDGPRCTAFIPIGGERCGKTVDMFAESKDE